MFDSLMTQSFSLYEKTQSTEKGKVIDQWDFLGTYNGRFDPMPKTLVFQNGKQSWVQASNFFCRSNVPIKESERVEIDGVMYDVLSVSDVFSAGHHKECVLERVNR